MMADERESRIEETAEEAAAGTVADEVIKVGNETAADHVVISETTAVVDEEGRLLATEERVVELYPEARPDLDPSDPTFEDAVPEGLAAVDDTSSRELYVVQRAEPVVAMAPQEEPEEDLEEFSTLQAVTLAFLVLLNILVIGLGIWQVSLYFGWL